MGAGELILYPFKVLVHCLRHIIFNIFILACCRQICCQGHGSRSNVIVNNVKDSHHATALHSSSIGFRKTHSVILGLAMFVQLRLVTDGQTERQTDRHVVTANTVLA